MKLNKISMVIAAMAFVGCSSEDFNDPSVTQALDDSRLVQLGENFVIAGVGEEGNTMRTHWVKDGKNLVNKFLPIYNDAAGVDALLSDAAKLDEQAVGLCWVGNAAIGTDVYTNYEFYHFGWLDKGETELKYECNQMTNGSLYSDLKLTAAGAENAEADPANFAYATGSGTPEDDLNFNTGIYKTDNKAIFGGQYIVYYPFNPEFKNAGTIPAIAGTKFDKVSQSYDTPAIGKATFRYSKPVTIEGGAQASNFGLYNLSAIAQLRVAGRTGDVAKNIDMIVLWSKKEQLLKQANLAADMIAAGKKGTELYASTEGTKTIVATFEAPVAVKGTSNSPTSAYITVLPTKVEDLVAFVHSEDGKWATVNLGETEFEAGVPTRVDILVEAGDFENKFIAVDFETLKSAVTEATGTATIQVIGDITLTDNLTINKPNITIKGDKIIVPEDKTLTLNTKMESDLQILGKSCCSSATKGGRLVVEGGKISNVTMEEAKTDVAPADYENLQPKVTFQTSDATVDADKTFDAKAGTIAVDAAVSHKANINIAEGVKLTVTENGDLNFMGATVVNNGTIEVEKNGKFDMTDKDGNATATDGKRMTNNGEFIHNVDAQVGTAVQSMNQNGTYRCRVDKQIKLDDAYQKWLACSVIEMVGAGQTYNLGVAEKNIEYKHNTKFIDIEVNTTSLTTFNNPDLGSGDGDNKNIQVGNLTVMQGGLYVPFVTGEGKRELTVNGDMTVSAKSSLYSSKKITVKENLKVEGVELIYCGKKQNEGGLAVTKDITVSGATGIFNADGIDALDITCANFTLADAATAKFGNRTNGDTKNLTVSGTISNPATCTFSIHAANQEAGSVLATITCKKLTVGGAFPGGKPQVVE